MLVPRASATVTANAERRFTDFAITTSPATAARRTADTSTGRAASNPGACISDVQLCDRSCEVHRIARHRSGTRRERGDSDAVGRDDVAGDGARCDDEWAREVDLARAAATREISVDRAHSDLVGRVAHAGSRFDARTAR